MTIGITGNETLDELAAILDSPDDADVVDEPLQIWHYQAVQ
ncbi:hypothetical protein [Photobacterium kishitanii]|nr:hypothetical protein [Photobacterium kishitanii]CEO39145.1 hypothetical protein PPBDW_I21161 [Photobacterium kishitanii]